MRVSPVQVRPCPLVRFARYRVCPRPVAKPQQNKALPMNPANARDQVRTGAAPHCAPKVRRFLAPLSPQHPAAPVARVQSASVTCRECPAAHALRPGGAQGCSHGLSAARVLAGAAQPVDSVKQIGPPRQGRRKFRSTDARTTRPRFQPTRRLVALMQRGRAALYAPLPARKGTARRDCRACRVP